MTPQELAAIQAAQPLPDITPAHFVHASDGHFFRPAMNSVGRDVPLPLAHPTSRIAPEAEPSYPPIWHGGRSALTDKAEDVGAAAHLAAVRLATERMGRTAKRTGKTTALLAAQVVDTHFAYVNDSVKPPALDPYLKDQVLRSIGMPSALPVSPTRFHKVGYPHIPRPRAKRLEPLALSPRGCFHSEHYFAKYRLPRD